MFTKLRIQNYKSIHDLELELGRVNVFIGENGCGKSNILEAVAFASAAQENRLRNDDLAAKGIRITRPDMMMNSFAGAKAKQKITIELDVQFPEVDPDTTTTINTALFSKSPTDITGTWQAEGGSSTHGFIENDDGDVILEMDDEQRSVFKSVRNAIAMFLKGTKSPEKWLNEKWQTAVKSMEQFSDNHEGWKKALLYNLTQEDKENLVKQFNLAFLNDFQIYELQTNPLRGFNKQSYEIPGRNGENLDLWLESFYEFEWEKLIQYSKFISWLDEQGILIDKTGELDRKRLKLRSDSKLYFRDKFMQKKNNIFSVENANEGALHILFYLALFISHKTPHFFAIDNIENGLNPRLCRHLIKNLTELASENDKQSLITTHNPAVLDGLNLHDDEQRLFVVRRNKKGHTVVKRVQLKPDVEIGGHRLKLSELWMRGQLGGLPQNF